MAKVEDKNGFWFIEHNPITKTGVYDYLGKQISPECEPNKIYKVFRPKEELFKKETLDSLRLIPIVNDHTMIGQGFTAPEDKGIDGTLGDNVSHDTDTIYNDLKIVSNKMKDDIRNGKKELSLGYFCRYDKQPGTYKGQRYDYIQRDIKANHLALVDKGRMGSDVRVYDSKNQGGSFAMDSIDIAFDREFKESDVNRDKNGRFATKGSSEEGGESKKHKSGLNSEKVKRFRELLNKKDTETIEKEFGKRIRSDYAIEQLKSSLRLKYEFGSKDPNLPDFEYLKGDEDKKETNEQNRDIPYQAENWLTPPTEEEKEKIQKEWLKEMEETYGQKKDNPFEKTLSKTGFKKDDNDYSYSKEYKNGILAVVHTDKHPEAGKYYIATIIDDNKYKTENFYYTDIETVFKRLNKKYGEEYKNTQGEDKMAELKKEKPVLDEDKRKQIDEIGGILKGKVDDEVWRTVIGKVEKVAYNASEAGKGTDEGEEVEEVIEEGKEKEKKTAKDKCGKDKEEEKVEVKKEKEEEKGMDEGKIVQMIARKDKLAKAVEKVIGTFDHSEMTEQQVAEYACDKLDLPVKKGEEITGIHCFLKSQPKEKVLFSYGMDSKSVTDEEFEKFQSKGE